MIDIYLINNYNYFHNIIKECKLNNDGANILPDLPKEFECNWENCDQSFECMHYFASHVADHLELTEFENYDFICPWIGMYIVLIFI